MAQEGNTQLGNTQFPRQIGKYKIEGLLTTGGMSRLYLGTYPLGTHPQEAQPVLIKVLLPKFLSESSICDRFLNEARIIALLDHPNIVKLYDYGRWEEGLYIAMEFVKGTSLRKILIHQPFSLKKALGILLQVSYALCHLHSHGVIHGDLKPENILISEQGQVKLIDFGIARRLAEKPPSPRQIVGTPIYMSPEQHQDSLNVSFQSDIYSLGIIAYELIMGKISHGRVIISLAPLGLQKILHKALQPNPEDRYSDMVDFIADLSQYIKSGTFQKDKHGSDYFLELFEKLEGIQNGLVAKNAPEEWIGYILRQGFGLNGLYCEFFDLEGGRKAFFIAEAQEKGAEGIILASNIRICLHTLLKERKELSSRQFIEKLKEQMQEPFFYSYLLLDVEARQYEFLHNDYAQLLHWTSSGIKKADTFGKYTPGDLLFLLAVKDASQLDEDLLNTMSTTRELAAQTQAESLLQKLRFRTQMFEEEQPFCILALTIPNFSVEKKSDF